MQNVLIVCYDFPPGGGAGVKRTMQLVKFLPSLGFRPTVLSVRNGNYLVHDESLLKSVSPDVAVLRSRTFEDLYTRGGQKKPRWEGVKPEASILRQGHPRGERSVVGRLRCYLKVPDSRILWLPAALLLGWRILRRGSMDVIYATGPSFTNNLLGAMLSRLGGVPLVSDFRDAWMADPVLRTEVPPRLLRIHAAQESFVIRHSKVVVTTNPFVTEDFRKRYGSADGRRYETVYNWYDPDDYALESPQLEHDGKIRVVHTGRLYGERSPRRFLEAVAMAVNCDARLRQSLEVIFVGACEVFNDGKRIEDYIEALGLQGLVRLTGFVSRRESLRYQAMADLLLCIIGTVPEEGRYTYGIAGKIFDYLPWRKPIMAVADEGASTVFVRQHGIGVVFSPDDKEGMVRFLMQRGKTDASGAIEAQGTLWQQFDARKLTRQLAGCLACAIGQGNRKRAA